MKLGACGLSVLLAAAAVQPCLADGNPPDAAVADTVDVAANADEADGVTEQSPLATDDGLLQRETQAAIPPPPPLAYEHHAPEPRMDADAQRADYDAARFGPDPSYADKPYDPQAQLAIYGNKKAVVAPRPAIEWGYPMYRSGPLPADGDALGELNPTRFQLLLYGDWRTAVASNDNGAVDSQQIATVLNLDLDVRFTATERFHMLLRPLDRDGRFTRYEFGGNQRLLRGTDAELQANLVARTAFFEGDLGSLVSGWRDSYTTWDLPFAIGLMPMFLQNGFWMDDAILGAAITLPARNSAKHDISNMDFTFFAGFDEVSTPAIRTPAGAAAQHQGAVLGATAFIERLGAYIELGYGYVHDKDHRDGDFGYHNLTAAYTRRYGSKLSNSLRLMANVGQDPGAGSDRTADGWMLVAESSLITHLPYTLVPYLNMYYAHGSVQSLARDPGAGGPLKNIGISFESDGLTGFPLLDDRARDSYGGAIGLMYLFKLDRQLVGEVAFTRQHRPSVGDLPGAPRVQQAAVSLRFQEPLGKQWILRADATKGWRRGADDYSGLRLEMRLKF